MLSLIFVTMPLAIGAAVAVLTRLPAVVSFAALGTGGLTMAGFYQDGLILSRALLEAAGAPHGMLNGTPFKSPVWRLVGVRIGLAGLRRRAAPSPSGRW